MPPAIENPKNFNLPPGATDIFKEMFADYGRVVIKEEFAGGLSGGRVFLVRPIRVEAAEERPDLPVAVKLASVSLIQKEWQAYQSYIHNRLPGIAQIRGKPILPSGSDWGGLCYPLLGGGIFDVVSLHSYGRQASVEDIRFVLGRLLKMIEQMVRLNWPSPEFKLGLSYDAVLPVNLLIAPRPPPAEALVHRIRPDSLPASPLQPGDYVHLEGFAITKVDLQRRTVTLNLPPSPSSSPASYYVRLQLAETSLTGQVNQIIAPLTGVILKTRQSQLQAEAQAALGQSLDLAAETLALPDGSTLPNPLTKLSALLNETRDVKVSGIHGDLNLENILVDPDVRDVSLIDFAEARRDHVLHDFLRLETEVLTKLLPEILAQHRLPLGSTVASFYQQLHWTTFQSGPPTARPTHAALEKPLVILEAIRQTARRYLADFDDPSEYYQGLTLYLLGALKYRNLSEAPEAPLPKQVAFWGAASACQSEWEPLSETELRRSFTSKAGNLAKPFEIPRPPRPTRPPEVPSFVGREAELAYYAEKLNHAHLVVIHGMAGVGKTTLAADLVRQEAKLDKIFWHSFQEREGVQAIIWRLAGFLAWHGQDELWRLLQSAQLSGGETPPPEMLFDYLFELIAGRNYLLCLDDFHFVEDDPWLNKLVERLKTTVAAGEVAIIMTSRRLPDFVPAVEAEPLQGLNRADARQLLARQGLFLPEALLNDLHQLTAGNAQFLTLAIEILQQAADPAQLIHQLAGVDDIERYLIAEVDEGLSGHEQAVMAAVAVLMGYPGTHEAIEAILDQGNVWRSLRHLTDRHLLIVNEGEAGKEYRQHAMVQAFYYQLLNQNRRRALHRRAAEYYKTEQPDLLKAGLHFERAGNYQEAAFVATTNVLDLINRGQALPLSELLKQFQAQQLATDLWLEVKLALGRVYKLLGEATAARASYEEAWSQITALPNSPASLELKARACGGIADLLRLEKPQEALAWLRQGLKAIEESDSNERTVLLVQMGDIQMMLGHYDEALSALEQGLAHLPEGPSQRRSEALKNLGAIYYSQGDVGRAKLVITQALEISRQLHDSFQETFILNNLGIDKYISGDWAAALEDFQQALRLAERIGSVEQKTMLNTNLGAAFIYLGDDERARTHLLDSLDLARQNNLQLNQVVIHYRLADLNMRWEKWAEAAVSLGEAEQLALALAAEGNLSEIYRAWAEIYLATGRYERALAYAQRAVDFARKLSQNLDLGMSLRVLGQIYLAAEDYPGASQAFEKSLSLLEHQDPYETARTRMQWGLAMLSGGEADLEKGRRLLHGARQVFKQLGAQRDLATVERLLKSYHGK